MPSWVEGEIGCELINKQSIQKHYDFNLDVNVLFSQLTIYSIQFNSIKYLFDQIINWSIYLCLLIYLPEYMLLPVYDNKKITNEQNKDESIYSNTWAIYNGYETRKLLY